MQKGLSVNISEDIKWNINISEIVKTLFSSTAETSENVPAKDLITFYTTCMRPVAEYACPACLS